MPGDLAPHRNGHLQILLAGHRELDAGCLELLGGTPRLVIGRGRGDRALDHHLLARRHSAHRQKLLSVIDHLDPSSLENRPPLVALALGDIDHRLIVDPDECVARDRDGLLALHPDLQSRVHVDLEGLIRVRQRAAHLGGPKRGIEGARHPVDRAFELPVWIGDDLDRDLRAFVDSGKVLIGDIGKDPDLVQFANREKLQRRPSGILPLHLHPWIDGA